MSSENAVSLLVEIASEEDPDLAKVLDGVGTIEVSPMPLHVLFASQVHFE